MDIDRVKREVRGRARWLEERSSMLFASRRDPGIKPPVRQLREMVRLRLSDTGLSPLEYHRLGLHDLTVSESVELADVCGSRMRRRLDRELNNPSWQAAVNDKALAAMIYQQARVPHPDLYAVFANYERSCGDVPVLGNRSELEAFLSNEHRLPMFCKPVQGGIGVSCHRIDAVDPDQRTITVNGGTTLSFDDYFETLDDPSGWGFLFQEAVTAAKETMPIAGDGVTGLRMVVLLGDDGPELFHSIWKIPVAGSVTDNFGQGNAAAVVDIGSGVVNAVHWGTGSAFPANAPHPDTGTEILGLRVPLWDEAKKVALDASRSMPGYRFQHWDVGLTSRGPVIYELNTDGGVWDDLPGNLGTFDERLRDFHSAYGRAPQHQAHQGVIQL